MQVHEVLKVPDFLSQLYRAKDPENSPEDVQDCILFNRFSYGVYNPFLHSALINSSQFSTLLQRDIQNVAYIVHSIRFFENVCLCTSWKTVVCKFGVLI